MIPNEQPKPKNYQDAARFAAEGRPLGREAQQGAVPGNALMADRPGTRPTVHLPPQNGQQPAAQAFPPGFMEALQELGQLIDLDGDGQPDIAVVPLNAMLGGR